MFLSVLRRLGSDRARVDHWFLLAGYNTAEGYRVLFPVLRVPYEVDRSWSFLLCIDCPG